MSVSSDISGHCLCGAVSFTAKVASRDVGACHCSMCRRWTGGPFMAVELVEPAVISGDEYLTIFQSSDWGERGFCKMCGTALFWRMQGGGLYAVSAGALDSSEGLNFALQIFVDEKPSFYDFANKTQMMTGAEVEATFGPGNQND